MKIKALVVVAALVGTIATAVPAAGAAPKSRVGVSWHPQRSPGPRPGRIGAARPQRQRHLTPVLLFAVLLFVANRRANIEFDNAGVCGQDESLE